MSSIMRCRSGLMALSVMRDAPVFGEGCEPLISRQDAPWRYRVGCVVRRGALPRERFSPLAQRGPSLICSSPLSAAKSGSRRAFSTAPTSKDPMTGSMTAAAENIRVLRGQVLMRQGKSPHIAYLRRNLPRRRPLAFVSLTVGPHPQGLQAMQLKKCAACRPLFSECAHGSPELRLTSRTDPFPCAAFSAYARVITDVAIFPVRGRRRKCADARR